MVLPVSAAAISAGDERNGSGFDPSQTETIRLPRARLSTPRATVSTSGNSGMGVVILLGAKRVQQVTTFNTTPRCTNPTQAKTRLESGTRMLLVAKDYSWIDLHRGTCGDQRCRESHQYQQQRDSDETHRIVGADVE